MKTPTFISKQRKDEKLLTEFLDMLIKFFVFAERQHGALHRSHSRR